MSLTCDLQPYVYAGGWMRRYLALVNPGVGGLHVFYYEAPVLQVSDVLQEDPFVCTVCGEADG